MTHAATLSIGLVFLAASATTSLAKEPAAAWRPLLGNTLDGWVAFTGVPHKTTTVPGFPASDSEDCRRGTPVGLSDPLGIFTIEQRDGEPVLHISGQGYAGLSTEESFSNYHLTCETKWGEKKYPPRLNAKRDSGLLIHCTGEHGAFWNVWMRCLECQVQETDCGDLIPLAGTSCTVAIKPTDTRRPIYAPDGEVSPVGKGAPQGYITRQANHERVGDWNRIDVFAVEDRLAFAVNGQIVMRIANAKNGSQADGEPLTGGKIQIQSESAEVEYRRLRIRPITQIPAGETVSANVLAGE